MRIHFCQDCDSSQVCPSVYFGPPIEKYICHSCIVAAIPKAKSVVMGPLGSGKTLAAMQEFERLIKGE